MTTGGYNGSFINDVELTSLDPDLFPVPDCLENLTSLPVKAFSHAGAVDYSREFCEVCLIAIIRGQWWEI